MMKMLRYRLTVLIVLSVLLLLLMYRYSNKASNYVSLLALHDYNGSTIKQTSGIDRDGILQSLLFESNQTITSVFPRYYGSVANSTATMPIIPMWTITSKVNSCIHRFFDSSPISPSGSHIAVCCLSPTVHEYDVVKPGMHVEIRVIRIVNSVDRSKSDSDNSTIILTTTAWNTQTGAHVQWGKDDSELYYNDYFDDTLRGVKYNMYTRKKFILQCPVYHINPLYNLAASPDLTKIHYTQQGYGVVSNSSRRNINASRIDGLYVTDTTTGICKLEISLSALVALIPSPFPSQHGQQHPRNIPSTILQLQTYGFHTKWHSDGKHIMFIVRSLNEEGFRQQHLFIIKCITTSTSSSSSSSSNNDIKAYYMLSWHTNRYDSTLRNSNGNIMTADGNHPNWIPASANSDKNDDSGDYFVRFSINIRALNASMTTPWSIVVYTLVTTATTTAATSSYTITSKIVSKSGSGHPYFIDDRYIVTDAYSKEMALFQQLLPLCIPIRLIDTYSHREVWLAQLQIERNVQHKQLLASKKQIKAWRCDAHVTLSVSKTTIVLNGRPDGNHRQVLVGYIGSDMGRFFR